MFAHHTPHRRGQMPVIFRLVCLVLAGTAFCAEPAGRRPRPGRIGIDRGICVISGDKQCRLALQLARHSELLIYVQLRDADAVRAACRAADQAGFYGKRIFIAKGSPDRIHLADNTADVIIARRGADIDEDEILRVLRPGGAAYSRGRRITKPMPAGADDWSHPYHGPDNNPQSKDQLIKAPYLTQFLADPRYGPLPQVAVASAGRIFKAFGHIAFKVREEPLLNTLVAFNGYNGCVLWKHKLSGTYMIHRNTIIATDDLVYVGDDKSCKLLDAETGRLRYEITVPVDITGGTFWKWMGLQDGVLYAVVGEQEKADPVITGKRTHHGWPWNPLSPGFNQPENPWGYGRTILAIDPGTQEVLWHYRAEEPADTRAVCMNKDRIFLFRFGSYLTCLNADDGKVLWHKTPSTDEALFKAMGDYSNRQDWRTNWRTTAYLKCSDKALYFAGPQVNKLLAVSTADGRILWEHPYNNFQLIIRDDAVYGISGQIDNNHLSMKFDPLTGRVLEKISVARRACTRPTASGDSIFFRANGGSVRLDIATNRPFLVSPMRPPCQDGVTVANGLLYWWPSVCDCNLTLYGLTALAPAGNFNFAAAATESERLEICQDPVPDHPLEVSAADWPTFRANNHCDATTAAAVANDVKLLWRTSPQQDLTPTAPTAAGGFVFVAGDDGIVRAFNAADGRPCWKAYTGGAIRIAPAIAEGRAFAGSGDGWVYAFDARTGRRLWRFRAAPAERIISVYGSLLSTWPAASGVIVQDGTAYVAAGIVNYDGTHVYALDAATGRIKWQNNSSGHLNKEAATGVSVQGHMLLMGERLALAGGNAVSPAIYDLKTGRCLNDPARLQTTVNNNVPGSFAPRGWELYKIGDSVFACGRPYYAHPEYPVYDRSVFTKTLLASTAKFDITWVNNARVICYQRIEEDRTGKFRAAWGKFNIPGVRPVWKYDCPASLAAAICKNAVVVAMESRLTALNLEDGKPLWTKPLPAKPVSWGMAVDRNGRIILTLENGQILCFGSNR